MPRRTHKPEVSGSIPLPATKIKKIVKNLKIYCISLNPLHKKLIEDIGYIPVGLGDMNFENGWLRDNTQENIAFKNPFYGEYTFHYWLWKNKKINFNGWIGFCQYRKFWSIQNKNLLPKSLNELRPLIINDIPESYENYDVILGEEYLINQMRLMKFLKKGFKLIIKKPSLLINKKNRNIKFHFDLMHGANNIERAIEFLDKENKNDFWDFINNKNSFNPHNMFICKSKEILNNYYSTIFPWLMRCEQKFGFEELIGWNKIRIYTFLAERFMSYWFQKNTKYKTMPIIFYDIRNDFGHKPL